MYLCKDENLLQLNYHDEECIIDNNYNLIIFL